MPIPFHDPDAGSTGSGAIGWLRFMEESRGEGMRAALFQTSVRGDPLAFCFSRMERRETAGKREPVKPTLVSSLAKSLFGAADPRPALILALADEVPEGTFRDDIRVGLPLCRIGTERLQSHARPAHRSPAGGRFRLLWEGERYDDETRAGRLLDEIMDRDDPVEPFDRAARCLDEAFDDERVRAMTTLPGMAAVVSLSSLPERPEYSANRDSGNGHAVHEPPPAFRSGPTLAERLWAVLAAPRRRDPDVQLKWPGELMPFQQEGVRALLDRRQLLLADDMGLGKTLQAIAALRILRARGEVRACLVAAPAGLLDQWRREIEKWAPELSAIVIRGSTSDRAWQWGAEKDVALVSYDTLRSDFGGGAQSPVRCRTWDVVVADEAQRIKNRNDTSDALKGLRRARSWALTGTPVENDEEELASILEFVDHDGSGPPRHYRPGMELRWRHGELQLRRKKGDVLEDLPPKQVTRVAIDLGPSQRNSYDKAEQEGIIYLRSLGAEVRVPHVLELVTRLKQVCNADPRTGESTKLEDIRDRLGRLADQGHKALLFSQYVSDTSGVRAAANYLEDFAPLTITGDMPQRERTDVIERFKARDEHKVLILSLRAGGLGLNLQEASYVFHLDRWWNPAVESQAEDRSHRYGQKVKVNVIEYSCSGTIEERIDEVLERKRELFDELIDDVTLDLSDRMNDEELFGLFGLKR